MSCYFRHMKDNLAEAGIAVAPLNRKEIDQAFHRIAGVAYKDCPAAWKELKQKLQSDEGSRRELAQELRRLYAGIQQNHEVKA